VTKFIGNRPDDGKVVARWNLLYPKGRTAKGAMLCPLCCTSSTVGRITIPDPACPATCRCEEHCTCIEIVCPLCNGRVGTTAEELDGSLFTCGTCGNKWDHDDMTGQCLKCSSRYLLSAYPQKVRAALARIVAAFIEPTVMNFGGDQGQALMHAQEILAKTR
jgi:hypothetical protein